MARRGYIVLHILMIFSFMNLLLNNACLSCIYWFSCCVIWGFQFHMTNLRALPLESRFLALLSTVCRLRWSYTNNEFYAILLQFAARKRARLRQLQQLAGCLNWACQVVRGGRCYLRRILDVIKPLKLAHHKVVLSESFYADIDWCLQFLPVFNGKCLELHHAPVYDVFVDASGTGSGFVFDTDWAYCGWRDVERSVNQFLSLPPGGWPHDGSIHVYCFIQTISPRGPLSGWAQLSPLVLCLICVSYFGCLRFSIYHGCCAHPRPPKWYSGYNISPWAARLSPFAN